MSSATQNGTVPHVSEEEPVDPLDRIAIELEAEKAPLVARRAQLESEIADLLRREERINAALSGLQQGRPKPAPKRDKHDWTVSQKILDDVYATIATADGPLTNAQIAEATGVSGGTVSKALNRLREQEKVRVCGNAPLQGSPRLYGTMR